MTTVWACDGDNGHILRVQGNTGRAVRARDERMQTAHTGRGGARTCAFAHSSTRAFSRVPTTLTLLCTPR